MENEISTVSDSATVRKTNTAQGRDVRCPTCCNAPNKPYVRRDSEMNVVAGCVDACHADFAKAPGGYRAWWNRNEARKIRRRAFENLKKYNPVALTSNHKTTRPSTI